MSIFKSIFGPLSVYRFGFIFASYLLVFTSEYKGHKTLHTPLYTCGRLVVGVMLDSTFSYSNILALESGLNSEDYKTLKY